MTTPTEWLVEYTDASGETAYDHIMSREQAIEFLCQLVGQGRSATLYQHVPFTVQVDVTVKAPRKRKRKEGTNAGAAGPDAQDTTKDAAAQEPAVSPVVVAAGEKPTSPVLWTCEARLPNGPECPGPVEFDPVTRGRFCSLHLGAISESGRIELHRRHGARNHPTAPVARLAG